MNTKKFLSAIALTTLTGLLVLPAIGLAVVQVVAPEGPQTPGQLLDKVEDIGDWIFTALLIIAAIFLLVAGFFWITAGGNPEQVNKARQMLINALIGVAIALLARGLVQVVRSIIGD